MTNTVAEDWLSREDVVARECRIARLKWMEDQLPQCEYIGFQGGPMALYLYEETRYCFAYGQFLATIVLGLAFIEHSLAARFSEVGNSLERPIISVLLTKALEEGWINQTEFDNLDHARKIRNPITHYREFGKKDTIEMRSMELKEYPYSVLEEDAYHVMETIFHLMGTRLLCHMV
jgi:hypothetical protein